MFEELVGVLIAAGAEGVLKGTAYDGGIVVQDFDDMKHADRP